jgi:plasmid stability protein
MISMTAITIRNLSNATHRALRMRAAEHGRSTEAEVRAILDAAVRPNDRLKMGSALVALFRSAGGVDLDIERDRTPVKPASFE